MNEERDALHKRVMRLPDESFEDLAIQIFNYQSKHNVIYRSFLDLLGKKPSQIQCIDEIPCLPIHFFKTHEVKSGEWKASKVFQSSGTTNQTRSKHYLLEEEIYNRLAVRNFENVYGALEDYCILALLPHYLEQGGSSLVYMINQFVTHSKYEQSGFFLDNLQDLIHVIKTNEESGVKSVLVGVSYALIDLVDHLNFELRNTLIMETGGMKGRREEWSKDRLHDFLKKAYRVSNIHSEYGMTELFSQAYSTGNGIFIEGISMKILIREIADPFENSNNLKSGVINVIDLANLDTCSFIETQDLGVKLDNVHFKLLGRLDNADIRGCNLMVQ